MKKHCVQLSNGLKMPMLGIGCRAGQDRPDVAAAVEAALLAGYRHIDTAYSHNNEEEVGKGIKAVLSAGKISRSDIFVVTKLPMVGMQPGKVERYLKKSLQLLNLEYVDLYLIHHPVGLVEKNGNGNGSSNGNGNGSGNRNENGIGNRNGKGNECVPMEDGKLKLDLATDLMGLWKDMEKMVRLGLANTIGVCNFNEKQLTKIAAVAEIPPAVLQIECHVYFQQEKIREVCQKHNIAVTAFGSLGSTGRKLFYEKQGMKVDMPDLLNNPVVGLVALRYKRTPAQVLLRFMVQQNITVIPKSTKAERIQENGNIFCFKLDDLDMAALRSLDQGEAGRYFRFKDTFPGYDEHPEYPL